MKDPKAEILLKFLRGLDDSATHLFLLGDIFDLWLADHRYFANRFRLIVEAVSVLIQRGVQVHYFEGNHDFHLKEFWQDQVGARVHEGPALMELGPWRVRVEHGDETNPEDKNYRRLRWALRSPPLEFLAFRLPSQLLKLIGENWSEHSRKKKPYVNETIKQRARKFAVEKATEQDFDFMVSGHIHMKDEFQFSHSGRNVTYFNLGTWLSSPVTLELTEQKASFKEI
jgi:UDP-2,3-diacylglucosamine hydrolase